MILTKNDFQGRYSLPESKYIDVNYYIDNYETVYLKKILGVDLYNEFIIDNTNLLIEKIWYEFDLCIGLKQVLIGFIFYEYNAALQSQNTVVGNVASKNENSESTGGYLILKQTYNEAVKNARLIQEFLGSQRDEANKSICKTVLLNTQFATFKPYDTVITVGDVVIPSRRYYSPYQVAAIINQTNPLIKFQQSNNSIKLFSETNLSGLQIKFEYNTDQETTLTLGDFEEQENIYKKYSYSRIDYIIF